MEVSLDEALANVVRHGLEGRGGKARVELELRLDSGAEPEFDPLAAPETDTSLAVEDRPVGGLGIVLVRKLPLFVVEAGREQALARVASS